MTSSTLLKFAAIGALGCLLSAPAGAADSVSQEIPDAAACTKTVSAMGANMGHEADVSSDGRPIYRYVLRTNGLDYEVVCDPATGVVGDVTPRTSH